VKIRKNCTKPDEIFTKNDLLKEIIIRLKDPKFLIDSHTNKQIALNSFFKSKIDFYILELEKYENENKKLKEFIFHIENNQNSTNKNNSLQNYSNKNTQKNYGEIPSTANDYAENKKNSSSMSSPYSYLNEDQLKYFTYVLIKNFEVKKIDYNTLKEVNIK